MSTIPNTPTTGHTTESTSSHRSPNRASAPAPGGRLSTATAVGVIAKREILVKITSQAYVVGTLLTLALVLVAGLLMPRISDLFASTDTVAVTAQTQQVGGALGDGYETTTVADRAAAEQAVQSGKADAALVPADTPAGVEIIALRDAPSGLQSMLSIQPEVTLLDANAPNPMLVYFIALGFGLVFMMAAMTYGLQMAQSVVEEKQSRIVEIILASVPAKAILAGKVLGNSALALMQVGLLAFAGLLTVQINGGILNLDGLGMPIIAFVILFAFAFMMVAALFGAAASLVSRNEDLNQAASPLIWAVMFPYIAVIMFNSNETALTILGLIPLSAPVAVPLGLYTGQFSFGFAALSLAILLVSLAAAVWLAARIYERSVLRTGKRITWKQALKG